MKRELTPSEAAGLFLFYGLVLMASAIFSTYLLTN